MTRWEWALLVMVVAAFAFFEFTLWASGYKYGERATLEAVVPCSDRIRREPVEVHGFKWVCAFGGWRNAP